MVALTLSSVIVALVSSVFLTQNNFYRFVIQRTRVQDNLRVVTDLIASEVRGVAGGGVTTAESRRFVVSEIDDFETLYLLGSEGVYTDPTFTGSPARRTVYQYAVKREVALDHVKAMTQVTGNLYVEYDAHVDGEDGASVGACTQSSVDVIGALMGSGSLSIESGSPVRGSPITVFLGSSSAALDAIGIEWDVLTDTDFPVDYEDAWPSCALPADSFTVTRFNGPLNAPSSVCGRGVLIVKGNFSAEAGFQWNGILLAGHIVDTPNNYRIDGIVVGGLDGNGTTTAYRDGTHIDYHRCYAFQAGKRLSHFEPVGSTWWEEM